MKKITEKPILISIAIFLTLILLGIFTSSFVVRDRLDHIVYANHFMQINESYESDITIENNNLSTVNVHMKNPALLNTGNVTFQIYDRESLIREVGFTGLNIGDPGDVKLKFAPIPDSAGKTYEARIIVSQDEPKLSVFVDDNNQLGGWYYFRNPFGLSGIVSAISALIGRIFSDLLFVAIWLGSLVVVVFLYFKNKN